MRNHQSNRHKQPRAAKLKRLLVIGMIGVLGSTSACTKSSGNDDNFLLIILYLLFFSRPQCTLLSAAASTSPANVPTETHADGAPQFSETGTVPNAAPAGPLEIALFDMPNGPQWIRYYEQDGVAIFGGDMRMPLSKRIDPSQFSAAFQRSVGVTSTTGRWPTQIPYVFEGGGQAIADQTDVRNAMAHWETYTSFRFVARTSQTNYMNFQADGTGCYSYVGMIGGGQDVNVDANCGFGAAVHEIGHALGLFHEQSRSDRDQYVTIDYSNIQSGFASNYDIASGSTNLITYDFGSIMHYGSFFFAANSSKPVMTKKDGSIISPNRTALTQCDVNGVKQMYGF